MIDVSSAYSRRSDDDCHLGFDASKGRPLKERNKDGGDNEKQKT